MRLHLLSLDDRLTPAWLVTTSTGVADAEPLGYGYFRTEHPETIANVTSVEFDAPIRAEQFPNDPQYASQYALGVIQAPAAWDVIHTTSTIVAVVDSGVDTTHPDLVRNLWTNAGEIPGNGRDDDGNGFIDDVHGYDFVDHDGDPNDLFGHGTHVAGIIASAGNNNVGVSGVAWGARIMPLRFLDAYGNGFTSDAIKALNYAVANGAKISNHSWGGAIASDALRDAIAKAQAAGHIVVGAAGNRSTNTDLAGNYPASFAASFDNVVSVAATTYTDKLASFSNYGATTVTLTAPGDSILSTLPGGKYGPKTGTSMAAPLVSGALALLWEQHPTWSYTQLIDRLKSTVDVLPTLEQTQTGRLNLARLLGGVVSPPPPTIPPPPPGTSPPPPIVPPPPIGFVPTPVSPMPVAKRETIAVGVPGGVRLLNADGSPRTELILSDGDFADGVRVASADLTGDGTPEIILATGPGVVGRVRVLEGESRTILWDFFPFGDAFRGGVFVAAGDTTGDGVPDVAITADRGGGARVRLFSGNDYTQIRDFFAIDDPKFRGGARAAIGDIDGDGRGDLAIGAGTGGGPRVALFSAATFDRLAGDFFAFEPNLRNGTYLALGDIDGDGHADLIAGAGPGGGPRVSVFHGAKLIDNERVKLTDFFTGDLSTRDGVRVIAKDLDGDTRADLVVGDTAHARGYTAKTLTASPSPSTAFGFDIAVGYGAVYVG